jgi:hypothetical protein
MNFDVLDVKTLGEGFERRDYCLDNVPIGGDGFIGMPAGIVHSFDDPVY